MCVAVLSGCNLFVRDNEKYLTQVVARIKPVTETKGEGENRITFTTEDKKIYKYQLIDQLNANAQSMMQEGMTIDKVIDELLNQLFMRELVLNDADRLIAFGEMEWNGGEHVWNELNPDTNAYEKKTVTDYTDTNRVKELIYDALDSTLSTIRDEIHGEYDEDLPELTLAEEADKTTYPLMPSDDAADADAPAERQTEVFAPDRARWPGVYGSEEQKSLERESMRRLVAMLKERCTDNYTASKSDKEKFKEAEKQINDVINAQGIEYVYPMLADTYYVEFLLGKNALQQVKFDKIQAHITARADDVDDAEVLESYNNLVNGQTQTFNIDTAAYATAVKDSATTVLYHPIKKYFYVKHVLLPFDDAQKARLDAEKTKGTRTPEQIEDFRAALVNEIVVYPHVNGEDDKTAPTTVDAVFAEIKNGVAAAGASLKAAERKFEEYIYKYNTDPGMFDSAKGYVVEDALGEGESETYMVEFAEAARDLNKNYRPGDVLPYGAVTDYGVHIMYFASRVTPGKIALYDYESNAEHKTYGDIIRANIKTKKEETEFTTWRDTRINYYTNVKKVYETVPKAYKDLLKTS
jgi:hypothetical protein